MLSVQCEQAILQMPICMVQLCFLFWAFLLSFTGDSRVKESTNVGYHKGDDRDAVADHWLREGGL